MATLKPTGKKVTTTKNVGGKATSITKANAKAKGKSNSNPNGLPLMKYPGDIETINVDAPEVTLDPFEFTDTSINYDEIDYADEITADQVSAGKITAGSVKAGTLADRFMTAADYALVDPSKIASEYGDINREQMRKNSKLSSDLALEALDTELQGLTNFAPAAAALKRRETAADNAFNQSEREKQLAASDPNYRKDLEGQAARARAFAEGRAPDSINDRALELGIRSRAADRSAAGGFGVNSSAARKASELMSAEQRIGLSQYGDQLLSSNLATREKTLLAPTQYSDAGAQIQVTPSQSGAAVAMQIAGQANAGNITADKALSNLTQQEQFKTGIQQDTNTINLQTQAAKDLNQAQLDLQADTTNLDADMQAQTTNVGNELQANLANQSANLNAASTNAANKIQVQSANTDNFIRSRGIQIQTQSSEKQFASQQNFQLATSNADRAFQAANANAGRALDVATSNRNLKFEVEKSNKTMLFQDQQARQAEAAANARASISASASAANARLSYAASQASLQATIAEKEKDRAFALSMAEKNLAIYESNRKEGQSVANAGAVGQGVARIPSIIQGISSIVTTGQSLYGSISGSGNSGNSLTTRDAIGQNTDGSLIYA